MGWLVHAKLERSQTTNPMCPSGSSVYRLLNISASFLAAAMLLSSCGQTQPKGATPPAPTLPTQLPDQYKDFKQDTAITACGFDAWKTKSDKSVELSGWGVIEAAAGVVPDLFIVKIEKDGKNYFMPASNSPRPDIASKLNNPALLRSGFTLSVPSSSISMPYTASTVLVFDNRLIPCEYKAIVQ